MGEEACRVRALILTHFLIGNEELALAFNENIFENGTVGTVAQREVVFA